ncbi:hypothetical protein AAC387_Pa09g2449 [Persea americana]
MEPQINNLSHPLDEVKVEAHQRKIMSGSDHSICYLLSSTSTSDGPRCVGEPEKDASKEHRPIGATSDSSGAGGEGGNKQATEAVLNLYTAIKTVVRMLTRSLSQ